MSEIVIHASGLTKTYRVGGPARYAHRLSDLFRAPEPAKTFCALDNISFDLRRGEILGIVGGNGAGKSTLLKILSRVVRPSAGEAEIHGRLASLLEVGTGFHPELTGRENIYMSGVILGMTRAEVARRFDEIVAFSGTERFIDTPIKRYSSGMQTRLGFAVAAHLEAEILFVDEVLAVGDAEFQKKCLGKMKEVATGGRTVVFVSHNMNSIQALCTKAMWLDKGKIRAFGGDVRHVTLEYLSGGQGVAKAEWVDSEDVRSGGLVVPRAMRLRNASGIVVSGAVSNESELALELDLEVSQVDPALHIGYAIYTEEGETLWWSYHTDRPEEHWPLLQEGRMRLRTALPPHLLNEGRYRIEFICGLFFRGWLYEPGASSVAIHLEIQGGLSSSPLWTIARPGLLAPVFSWDSIALQ